MCVCAYAFAFYVLFLKKIYVLSIYIHMRSDFANCKNIFLTIYAINYMYSIPMYYNVNKQAPRDIKINLLKGFTYPCHTNTLQEQIINHIHYS